MALILWIFLIMSCIGHSKALFLEVGNYPNVQNIDVNRPDCGLREVPIEVNVHYSDEGFVQNYSDRSSAVRPSTSTALPRDELRTNRVAFGQITDVGEAPWAVWIEFYAKDGLIIYKTHDCSGTLVTFWYVITSSHCINRPPALMEYACITAGNRKKGSGNCIKSVPRKWMDPDCVAIDRRGCDIALMKVIYPFEQIKDKRGLLYKLNPICLPKKTYSGNNLTDTATFYGFGKREGDIDTDWLRRAEVTLMPAPANCHNRTVCSNFTNVPVRQPRPCKGDSGGGLVQYTDNGTRGILVGPHRGYRTHDGLDRCGDAIWYGYWVLVSMHMEWILGEMVFN